MPVRTVSIAALAAPIAAVLLLAGCSSAGASAGTSGSASAVAPAGTTSSSSAAAPAADSGADGSGTVTFTGTYSGTITIDSCTPDVVSLTVKFDGHGLSSGGIDKYKDFGINGPKGEIFTTSSADEPTLSGKTYTVKNAKLTFQHESMTANGTLTCP